MRMFRYLLLLVFASGGIVLVTAESGAAESARGPAAGGASGMTATAGAGLVSFRDATGFSVNAQAVWHPDGGGLDLVIGAGGLLNSAISSDTRTTLTALAGYALAGWRFDLGRLRPDLSPWLHFRVEPQLRVGAGSVDILFDGASTGSSVGLYLSPGAEFRLPVPALPGLQAGFGVRWESLIGSESITNMNYSLAVGWEF